MRTGLPRESRHLSPFDGSSARRLLLSLCALKIVAIILVIDPAGLVAFQLPKSLASRAIEWPMAATVGYALLAYGRTILPSSRIHAFVFAFVAVSAASAVFAAEPYLAVYGDPENYAGLTLLLDMVVLYVACAVAVREERDVGMLLGALVAGGIVAMAYGAVQRAGLDPFTWAEDPRSRPFSTFGNADHFGHFLSLLFGVVLGVAFAAGTARARTIAAAGVLATLAMAAIVATRGTLLGIAAALAAVPSVRRPGARGFALGVLAVGVLAALLASTPLGQRALASRDVGDRLALYGIAVRATLARPVLGYGPDNHRVAFADNRTPESVAILGPGPQSTAHDWMLDASTTTGVPGVAALIALVAVGTVALWRLALAWPKAGTPLLLGWVAYWSHGLVAAASMAAMWFPWVALGCAVGLAGDRAPVTATRLIPRWATLAIAAIALFGAASGARAFQADRDAWSAEEALHFGEASAAVTFADRAAARDGGRADNWNRLGLAFEAEARWAAAADAYREAARRARYEAVYWSNLARALARTAGTDGAARDRALDAARQATVVDRNAPVGHVVLAEVALAFGRCDLARTEATRAAALERGHEELLRGAEACR